MKTFKHLFAALLLLCSTVATAHDFVVDGIYYSFTSNYDPVTDSWSSVNCVAVTYRGDEPGSIEEYFNLVDIPAEVTYEGTTYQVVAIGDNAFEGNAGLRSLIIPNSVKRIGNFAFGECDGLSGIEIPNSVTSIGVGAFLGCDGLTSIEIPNSVTSIGGSAFSGSSLTSIEIPNSVTSIGEYAFTSTPWYNNQPDGVVYAGKCLYKYKGDMPANTSIAIEEGTLSISPIAFEYCTGLTNIEIPNTVISIGYCAFSGCTGLTSITLPASAAEYEFGLFSGCTGLTSIISYISAEDVADRSAYYGFDVFYDFDFAACTLYVPYGAKETYAASDHWNEIENIVEMAYELNVTAAGYATLYLGYAAEIPAGVEVYTANAVEDDLLKMQPVEGVIPANTGVIVKAAPGTYTFNNADDTVAAIEGNLFKGSLKDETVKVASGKAAYVLSMVDGEVGMYRAELTGHSFLNNANKAYLLLDSNNLGVYDEEWDTSAGGQLSNGFRFDFGGITGIENVKGESGEVKTIYDLSGRAVENPSKGLYIINGKKVLVK